MKKIYNIPVYKDAERLGAYLEGNLSEDEQRQMEIDIQNDPELAELAKDDIIIDWDDDINDDYPDFDWQKDGDLLELFTESSYRVFEEPEDLEGSSVGEDDEDSSNETGDSDDDDDDDGFELEPDDY